MLRNKGPIDLVHLEKYVAGDDELRDEIFTIFNDQAVLLCAQFSNEHNDDAWWNTAHALKGASRGIGAWALGDLCEDAEGLVGEVPGKAEKRSIVLVSIRQQISEITVESERVRSLGECV